MKMNPCKSKQSLNYLIGDSVDFQYIYGVAMRRWEPHQEKEWRILPYATIVTMGDREGAYTAEIKGKGIIRVHANSVLVIPAGEAFKLELRETAYLGNAHIAFTIFNHIDILSFFNFPCLIEAPISLDIIKIVDELALSAETSEDEAMEFHNMIHMKCLAFHLLELLVQQAGQRNDMSRRLSDMNRLQEVLDYMNEHLAEEISRQTLADIAGLSETRFHYVFKDIMGASPMNYLMMLRLKGAQKKLLITNDSVTEIADAVGFHNVSYFSKLFKNKFHVSPLQYRQMKKSHLWI